MKHTAFSAVLVSSFAIALLPACSAAHGGDGHDITAVNDSVNTSPGQTYGKLTTVNGDVRVVRGAGADEARTVNGDVVLEDDAQVGTARTVNGALRIGSGASIAREAQTVNGDVTLAARARVGGDVSTVSGEIELAGAEVTGKLVTRNGDIDLTDGARVHGGIHVQKTNDSNWGYGKSDPIKVHVCGTCVVDGELLFEQPVELRVDNGGKIGAVKGDKVKRL